VQASARGTWQAFAIVGFTCMGVTNFLLGCIGQWAVDEAARVTAPMLVWLTMGVVGAVAIGGFRATGRGLRGIPDRTTAAVALTAGVTLAVGMLTLTLGLAADPHSHGPIVAITAANSMLVALLSLRLLGERLTRMQVAGLVIVVAGVVLVGLSAGLSASLSASLSAVGYGLFTMLVFGVTNFLLKIAAHRGADSISTTALLWVAAGACGVVTLGVSFATGRGLAGIDSIGLVATAGAAGLTLGSGMLSLKLAMQSGPAGPVTAIVSANAVLLTILDFLAFGHVPDAVKLAGMVVALAGVAVLAGVGGRRAVATAGGSTAPAASLVRGSRH
jgi:drug/metabolite transporter (DMT)-like permease